jgi:purine-binding chemotaxis protein CheW
MQILTFFLGDERFAIDIALVDTIENSKPVTTVPKSKKYITGLISNRGNVLPVINTSMLLKHNNIDDIFQKLIIVNLGNDKIALGVNEIDDVLDIDNKDIQKINGNENLSVVNFNSNIITLLTYNELLKI